MFSRLKEDIRTVFEKDPAARSTLEVICCYPGVHAIWLHRISHFLWLHRFFFFARLLSYFGRSLTGIEIHPGAKIGRRFFIDHGSGVVIGETSEIGDDVLMYQGVVLGGTSLSKGKRHPTVGDGVVFGTKAIALGPITVGSGARIGAGSVVFKSVPAGATVVGIPGRVVKGLIRAASTEVDLEHGKLPDPLSDAINRLLREQEEIKERLRKLEAAYLKSASEVDAVLSSNGESKVLWGAGI